MIKLSVYNLYLNIQLRQRTIILYVINGSRILGVKENILDWLIKRGCESDVSRVCTLLAQGLNNLQEIYFRKLPVRTHELGDC